MIRRPPTKIELRMEDDIEEHQQFRARLKNEGASFLKQLREEHALPNNLHSGSLNTMLAQYELENLAEFLEINKNAKSPGEEHDTSSQLKKLFGGGHEEISAERFKRAKEHKQQHSMIRGVMNFPHGIQTPPPSHLAKDAPTVYYHPHNH